MKHLFLLLALSIQTICAYERIETDDQSGSMVFIVSPDWATVFIDNIQQGEARQYNGTAAVLKIKPGVHQIRLVADGYLDYEKRVYISDTRERFEVVMQPANTALNPVRPHPTKKTFGSLYLLGSALNPYDGAGIGMGAALEFTFNSQTTLHLKGQILSLYSDGEFSSPSTALAFGPAITPFDGDIRPQIGFVIGATGDQTNPSLLLGALFKSLFTFTPKTELIMGIEPELVFDNETQFYLNFSIGTRVLFGK